MDITEFSVTPSQIIEGQDIRLSLEAVNTGNKDAEIWIEEEGGNFLQNYCPDLFEIESFSASTSTVLDAEDENLYVLGSGESIRLEWGLDHHRDAPLYGHSCDISLEVPFSYSASSFQQMQIIDDREQEYVPLDQDSTGGPLEFVIDSVPGRTGDSQRFIASEDDGDATILVQLANRESQTSYNKGLVEIDEESLSIQASDPIELDESLNSRGEWESDVYDSGKCQDLGEVEDADRNLNMHEGSSNVLRCNVELPETLDSPSEIFDVTASVDYRYIKDAGSRTVEVESSD